MGHSSGSNLAMSIIFPTPLFRPSLAIEFGAGQSRTADLSDQTTKRQVCDTFHRCQNHIREDAYITHHIEIGQPIDRRCLPEASKSSYLRSQEGIVMSLSPKAVSVNADGEPDGFETDRKLGCYRDSVATRVWKSACRSHSLPPFIVPWWRNWIRRCACFTSSLPTDWPGNRLKSRGVLLRWMWPPMSLMQPSMNTHP